MEPVRFRSYAKPVQRPICSFRDDFLRCLNGSSTVSHYIITTRKEPLVECYEVNGLISLYLLMVMTYDDFDIELPIYNKAHLVLSLK